MICLGIYTWSMNISTDMSIYIPDLWIYRLSCLYLYLIYAYIDWYVCKYTWSMNILTNMSVNIPDLWIYRLICLYIYLIYEYIWYPDMIGESIIQMKIIINWRKEFISAPKCYFFIRIFVIKKNEKYFEDKSTKWN